MLIVSNASSIAGTTPSVLKVTSFDTIKEKFKARSPLELPVITVKVVTSKYRTLAFITRVYALLLTDED